MGSVKRAYSTVRDALLDRGVYLSASRRTFALGLLTETLQPEFVNKAYFKPFVKPDRWHQLYIESQTATRGADTDNLMRQCRFYSTFQFAEYAAGLAEGDVVECGCWHGHSTVAIATLLAEAGFAETFHVFDSFEGGLSEFKSEDESFFSLSEDEKKRIVESFASSFEFVEQATRAFGFVELHRGWIPKVFENFTPNPVKFLHVDVDMYEPTKAALELFWPHLVEGGVVICDDYNSSIFEGATRAVDEFLEEIEPPKLVYRPPMGSIALLK